MNKLLLQFSKEAKFNLIFKFTYIDSLTYNPITKVLFNLHKKYFDKAGINFFRESGRDITDTPFKLTSIFQVSNCPGTSILLIKN